MGMDEADLLGRSGSAAAYMATPFLQCGSSLFEKLAPLQFREWQSAGKGSHVGIENPVPQNSARMTSAAANGFSNSTTFL